MNIYDIPYNSEWSVSRQQFLTHNYNRGVVETETMAEFLARIRGERNEQR